MAKHSDFGKGCAYCLGLFLAHAEGYRESKRSYIAIGETGERAPALWFNASSDHFYELVIPEQYPEKLKKRLKKLQSKCLNFGHGDGLMDHTKVTEEDVHWSVKEAEALLMEIDKLQKIEAVKATWP